MSKMAWISLGAEKPWTEMLRIRGPGNSAFLVEMDKSKDVYELRFLLKHFILKRHRCKYEESGVPEFEKSGYVTTKASSDCESLTKDAVEVAKDVGALKVIPVRDKQQLQFVCEPNRLVVTSKKLRNLGYEVDSVGVTYVPLKLVRLGKKDRITCKNFLRVLDNIPNVVRIYNNIYR